MSEFNHRKWFKNQYLEEGHTEDKEKELQQIKRFDQLSDDDKLKLAKIQAMMDRERSLREDDLEEIRYPQEDFTQSQLVPRMESMVDRETYKRFVDSLDNLLDDWYMEGFEKDDVLAFMKVIIPSS
tara:strand:+ start:487 stop:864 length:378 start_codon:yes stop_codon:yes gene_type:complete